VNFTTLDLFRAGNAAGAKLDAVRAIDVVIYAPGGIEWVRGRSGGISTFDAINPALGGRWWRLPAGAEFDSALLFVWNDYQGHWSWEPALDMPLNTYRAALSAVNARFVGI
jgi:hypothetical protein